MNPQPESKSGRPSKAKAKKRPRSPKRLEEAKEALQVGAPDEVDWQRAFLMEKRLREAQIPRRFQNKTLANFEKSRDTRRILDDARRFINEFNLDGDEPYPGITMMGPVGCGKSHIAVAILREVIAKGYSGLYYNSPDLLLDIRATYSKDSATTEDTILEEVSQVDLLVLDDVGAENVSGFVLDRFYLIINKRYEECKPLIVTTNLSLSELKNRLESRIVSRLIEMAPPFVKFPEYDYRRRGLDNMRG